MMNGTHTAISRRAAGVPLRARRLQSIPCLSCVVVAPVEGWVWVARAALWQDAAGVKSRSVPDYVLSDKGRDDAGCL
jgi:hypothetical protein